MASKKTAPEGPIEVPEIISILPLRNSVLFPGSIIPIDVGRKKSVKLVEEAISKERPVIGIVTQRDARTEEPGPSDLFSVGCAARILKVIKLAKDNFSVILQGVSRIRLLEVGGQDPFMTAKVQPLPDAPSTDVELDALVMNLKDVAKRVIKLMPELPKEASALVDSVTEPGQLADLITSNLDVQVDEKQDVLETFDLKNRLRKVLQFLSRQHEVLKVREKINSQVQEEMGRNQREYVLRQQLKAIKEELGEIDDSGGDLDDFREKVVNAKMPPETEKVAMKQLERLKVMQPSSAEYTVTRTYLEWLVELPWAISTEDKLDIQGARDILNADHYDLEKVKKRILEYLAVRKLKADKRGPILCLVGPPGVGKTSLGRSIARSLGRKFIRISLGGVRDEAEIRGHRRTYVGSLPGRLIQGMKKAGSNNPVFMLDEIDKLGHDFRGDPAAALLEVLDPEQNHTFSDHYLEVPFDLSKVMFVATANIMDPIPPALRDRLEVLELPGYTREEKLNISKQFLIPKQLSEHGLDAKPEGDGSGARVVFEDAAVAEVIDSYTREAGVRNLERELANVIRAVAVLVAEGKAQPQRGRHRRPHPGVPRAAKAHLRGRGADGGAGRGDRPRLDAGRRRHPVHRGDQDERQGPAGADRTARRRDEGVGAGGAVVHPRAREVAGARGELPREDRHPRAHPGGRDPQGRTVGGRDHVRGDGVAADRQADPQRRGDDRRDHAARAGAAGRRHQGEVPGRAPRRHQARHHAGAQPQGRDRHPRAAAQGDRDPLRQAHGRAPAAGLDRDAEARLAVDVRRRRPAPPPAAPAA